jgi:preprotein translocase subunit SecY
MNKFLNKFKQVWAIEDLKTRILNTLLFLLVYRLGSFIVLPGIDSDILRSVLDQGEQSNMVSLINQFAGGAFSRASIFALGVMPRTTQEKTTLL